MAMPPIGEWWEKLVNRIVGKEDQSVKRKVLKCIGAVLAVLALLTILPWLGLDQSIMESFPSWLQWVPKVLPLAPYAFFVASMFFTRHAAAAWETAKGPLVWMGGIEFAGDPFFFFEFPIRYRGKGEVIAYARATELRDRYGERIQIIDPDGMPLHFRGYYEGQKVRLWGDKHAIVAFLQVQKGSDSKTAYLRLLSPAPEPAFRVAPLVFDHPLPLEEQRKMYLSIRVDFFRESKDSSDGQSKEPKEEFLTTKTRRVAIIPNERKSSCYQVRPIRWWLFE